MNQLMNVPDRWRAVEFRHLLALRAVAAERSFHRAASLLGYTQSAISQQIAALERIVGERLIERPGGRTPVALTEAGTLLVNHADAIAARLATAEAEFSSLRSGSHGTLKIGAYQSVGARLLPDLLRRFVKLHPKVKVDLFEGRNDVELLRGLEFGETDLAFVDLPLADGPFESVELLRDPYVVVVGTQSALAASGSAPLLVEIAAMPLLVFKTGRCVGRFLPHLSLAGSIPNVVFRSDQNDTLQAMAAAGLGVAILPRLAVDESDERVRVLEPDPPLPPREIALAWHSERVQPAIATAFAQLAQAAFGAHTARNRWDPGVFDRRDS
jgi:DNA-binding transcriptional LysR family regulator